MPPASKPVRSRSIEDVQTHSDKGAKVISAKGLGDAELQTKLYERGHDAAKANELYVLSLVTPFEVEIPDAIPHGLTSIKFAWSRCRYVWRIRLVYDVLFWLLMVLIVASWVFTFISKHNSCPSYNNCGFFHNYECSAKDFTYIVNKVFADSCFYLAEGVLAFGLARLLGTFLNTTMKDVMDAGKAASRAGCLVKYLPWGVAVFHILFLEESIATLIYVLLGKCRNRMNMYGLQAVENCRLFIFHCCHAADSCKGSNDVNACNDLSYLQLNKFLVHPIAVNYTADICDFITGSSHIPFCISGDLEKCFLQQSGNSDFFKYIFIWCLGTVLVWTITTIFLILTKYVTPLESFFFQIAAEDENAVFKFVREYLTPWS